MPLLQVNLKKVVDNNANLRQQNHETLGATMSGNDDPLNLVPTIPHIGREPWEGLHGYLSGLQYPATKQSILAMLRKRGGLAEAVATAEKIPDREYADCDAVRAEFLKV